MSKTVELTNELEAIQGTLAKVFQEAGDDYDFSKVTVVEGNDSAAKAGKVRELNDRAAEVAKELEEIEGWDGIKQFTESLGGLVDAQPKLPERDRDSKRDRKKFSSPGEEFISGGGMKKDGPGVDLKAFELAGLKTTMTTSTGVEPWDEQSSVVVRPGTRELTVLDLIPSSPTAAQVIVYRKRNPFVNSAATVAEGAAKPEGGISYTRKTEQVEKIAVWVPVTDEQLDDVPGMRALIDDDLRTMVREELEDQVIAGDGTSPNLSGILDRSGLQTQAKGGDPTPDAIFKAMVKIRTVGKPARPTGVVLNPLDWQDIRLLRTSDGVYIWGNPADTGPERIWGIPVVQSEGLTENTGLVGDFRWARLRLREDANVKVGFINDQFITNEQTILAEMRAALMVLMDEAFCKVTGI